MGRGGEGLAKLDAMGAIVEVENPTARRAQMVAEWFAASKETKSVRTEAGPQEDAKTALMVAPTWAEIDALNTHARGQLRATGKFTGDEHTFASLGVFLLRPISPTPRTVGRVRNCGISASTSLALPRSSASLGFRQIQQ